MTSQLDRFSQLVSPIPPSALHCLIAISSYYGLTFLLPTYYRDIFGAADDFVYILSSVLGVVIALGKVYSGETSYSIKVFGIAFDFHSSFVSLRVYSIT